MKERPILFSGSMVRAILAGTKTQTRLGAKMTSNGHIKEPGGHRRWHPADPDASLACPYGQPGDRLWVRETWHGTKGEPNVYGNGCFRYYRADYEDHPAYPQPFRWTPSIHMPRWASRITLEVTGVRVERLQDISEADAIAEGIEPFTDFKPTGHWRRYRDGGMNSYVDNPITSYASLWEEINGPGSWDANPWVWCVEFKRVEAS